MNRTVMNFNYDTLPENAIDAANILYDEWKADFLKHGSDREFSKELRRLDSNHDAWLDFIFDLLGKKGENFTGWSWNDAADAVYARVRKDMGEKPLGPNLDGSGSFRAKPSFDDDGCVLSGSFTENSRKQYMKTRRNRINENQKVTLTLGQLKRLVRESNQSEWDFDIREGVLVKYNGAGGDVVVPDGVKEIMYDAFYRCHTLTSITLPIGLEAIGECAFGRCTNLKSVSIPSSVRRIENEAFLNCTGLKKVEIPDYSSLSEIGKYAFSGCTSLTYIKIPKSVKVIKRMTFSGCENLRNATVQNSTEIEDEAFPEHTIIEEF